MEDLPKIDEFGMHVAGMQESFEALAEMVALLLRSVARGGALIATSTDLSAEQAMLLMLDGCENQLKQKLETVKAWTGKGK
jgi:hypothetical protein